MPAYPSTGPGSSSLTTTSEIVGRNLRIEKINWETKKLQKIKKQRKKVLLSYCTTLKHKIAKKNFNLFGLFTKIKFLIIYAKMRKRRKKEI